MALLGSCVIVGAAAATPSAAPLAVRQDPYVRHLLMPGDRVSVSYVIDTPGVKSPQGTLFVRNDLQKSFQRVAMKP